MPAAEPSPAKSFKFFRASLQETLRNAAGSRSKHKQPAGESAADEGAPATSDRKRAVLRKQPDSGGKSRQAHPSERDRPLPASALHLPGWTSLQTPSLSQASMSSPDLLQSAAIPDPRPRQRRPSQLVPIHTRAALVPKDRSTSSPLTPSSPVAQRPSLKSGPPSAPLITSSRLSSPTSSHIQSSSQSGRLRAASASTSHLPQAPSTPRATSPATPSSRMMRVSNTPQGSRIHPTSAASPTPPSPSPAPGRRPSYSGISRTSSSPSRSPTPSRNVSSPIYLGHRQNPSTASLGPSPYRETMRAAAACLVKEFARRPPHFSVAVWQEVEVRLRALLRLERIWGKSGGGASTGLVTSATGFGGGEERERRIFLESLRDGYALCQLINKFQPGVIQRADAHEDGFVKTSNVTKFLAAAASYGLPQAELFGRDDLLEGTPESLARVAQTIITLCKLAETPRSRQYRSPYMSSAASSSQQSLPASVSTPNLISRRASSPTSNTRINGVTPVGKKRWSPPSPGLPTVRSTSPAEAVKTKVDDSTKQPSAGGSSSKSASKGPGDAQRAAPLTRSTARPAASSNASSRASVASTMATAVTTAYSSEMRSSKFGTVRTMNTELTEATSLHPSDAKSSLGPADGQDLRPLAENGVVEPSSPRARERPSRFQFPDRSAMDASSHTPNGSAVVDLSRVPEDDEEGASTRRRRPAPLSMEAALVESSPPIDKPASPVIRLGKGKWPDDFLNLNLQAPAQPIRVPSRSSDSRENGSLHATSAPIAITLPGRKVSIREPFPTSGSPPDQPLELLPSFPVRNKPQHKSRHSVDTPGLLPKDSPLLQTTFNIRDRSPSFSRDSTTPSPAPLLRRQSTRSSPRGSYIPKSPEDRERDRERGPYLLSSDPSASTSVPALSNVRVPFPRGDSQPSTPMKADFGADSSRQPSSVPSSADTLHVEFKPADTAAPARPTIYQRGRFQSEMDASRRKPRPISLDDGGSRPGRSRFESMINLGVTANLSSNDLLSRENSLTNGGRQTLIVREEGKAPMYYQLGNCIGRGQFGAVYRALNKNTGQMVAVKRVSLAGLKEAEVETLMREVSVLKSLSHPSIVKYEGMLRDHDTLNIVLEYVENGSLGQTLKAFGKFNEKLVASYVVKILEGLHYLHRSHVVHCDLKCANILTTKNGNVKLSDFGVSLNLHAMENKSDVAGTPNWMAPEVIELKGASTASDIWSLGCTVVELLTGRPPYADIPNGLSVMFHIVEDDTPPIPEECSELLQDFLSQCFQKDPAMRPSAELLFEHDWLKRNWGPHKELRPQDSIPFLRRLSTDLHKSDIARQLSGIELPYSESPYPGFWANEELSGSPGNRLLGTPGPDPELSMPRAHSFVKTTFSKPVICRVCHQSVKKSAVLCEECSLIAHARCAADAPPTCDLRAQLLLYAQYSQAAASGEMHPQTPLPSMATPTPLQVPTTPNVPTADRTSSPPNGGFRLFPWKRRSSTPLHPAPEGTTSPPPNRISKPGDDRTRSRVSLGSSQQSSMRSAVTANEAPSTSGHSAARSQNAAQLEGGRVRHSVSVTTADNVRASRVTQTSTVISEFGADLPDEPNRRAGSHGRRPRESASSRTSSRSGCIVQ